MVRPSGNAASVRRAWKKPAQPRVAATMPSAARIRIRTALPNAMGLSCGPASWTRGPVHDRIKAEVVARQRGQPARQLQTLVRLHLTWRVWALCDGASATDSVALGWRWIGR